MNLHWHHHCPSIRSGAVCRRKQLMMSLLNVSTASTQVCQSQGHPLVRAYWITESQPCKASRFINSSGDRCFFHQLFKICFHLQHTNSQQGQPSSPTFSIISSTTSAGSSSSMPSADSNCSTLSWGFLTCRSRRFAATFCCFMKLSCVEAEWERCSSSSYASPQEIGLAFLCWPRQEKNFGDISAKLV